MYDFKSARRRIEELKLIYRQNKKHHEKDDTRNWVIVAQIEEIEKEIEEAHKNRTAVLHDDRSSQKKGIPNHTTMGRL
ncbi:hypothetical protein ERICIV_03616 [Paenibacillus larvae subsp. larvae]|uniref:Uncharacterized protein n=1 Tax=Paenibacillus larvae subsp. larvae TaxID=147375 RepID=A0A2L1UHS9_9BACL|nr:hypothetical protein [Paenibacillus larvae]AQZ46298.1 hypothetical protein B5S25_06310 [Paenibacillus larvae subsp. pulvifaciens]AVF27978.1 hypothetical protein ERICIII_03874 [Paenibacillus larvae subsp. larvae]AVF32480.1 hypothetical protein ERICIV_03616 [Paenibacillus larvae subsp. larvae]MBH0344059.1 hypothetical protein [Paenibacillus larvae]MCY7519145.1 hypothetical protein [Paenibacillus larvae]